MKPCPEYLDELALAAGGDLPVEAERVVLLHAEGCEPCAAFLASLTADQGVIARATLGRETFESLVPAVMARVATETHGRAVRAALGVLGARGSQLGEAQNQQASATPAGAWLVGHPSGRPSFGAFARLAAVMVIVVGAGLLGMATLPTADSASPGATADSAAQSTLAGPQMVIRRLPGEAMELSWAGDGREGSAAGGAGRPYIVLASADPRSFAGAKEVTVAGHSLVTDLPLPAAYPLRNAW